MAPRPYYKRMYSRYGKKVEKGVKKVLGSKRYNNYKSGLGQLMSDVKLLKKVINAEKKTFTQTSTSGSIGQVNGNGSGHYLFDLTPVIAQGTGYQNRVGNSVKWCSGHLQFLFQAQSAVVKPIYMEIHLVRVNGQPFSTMSDVMGKYITNNAFVNDQTIYDTNSPRETDYFKNFTVIRKIKTTFTPQFSGERVTKELNVGFKLNEHHIKWSADTATVSEGQIFLLILLNNGNSSGATANTSASGGVITQFVSSGIDMKYNNTQYFYDN